MKFWRSAMAVAVFLFASWSNPATADQYGIAQEVFKSSGEAGKYFDQAYGYALFPNIGKGGFIVGAAYGPGKVYRGNKAVGETSVVQLNVGFLAGGKVYSEIIFLRDKKAFDEFTDGNFEFNAQASATALTASASVEAGSTGASATMSATESLASTSPTKWVDGMAVFTIAKGGFMYNVSVAGQKFSYTPLE